MTLPKRCLVKKTFGADPQAVKVEWVANFRIVKYGFFSSLTLNFWPKSRTQVQVFRPNT